MNVEQTMTSESAGSSFPARRITLEVHEADPHGYCARVRMHIEDLQALLTSKDRRSGRNVLDRLVRMRFLCVGGSCLCTPDARLPQHAARFDGWVHAHHKELTALLDSLFTLDQRRALLDTAERYQTCLESKDIEGAPSFEELRIVQDWLFQPLEREFRSRFTGKTSVPHDSGA